MTFTTLGPALIAAALAVPALLLLYFLKLRRLPKSVPSTLLWKRAVQDLQVNAPFQRLRKNLLLFLQLLILLSLLFALSGPMVNFRKPTGRNIVVLIDRSGSMKARESDGRSRLDHARDEAITYLRGLKAQSRAMVISFADRAEVVCAFTEDLNRLASRINDIQPTDGPSRIGEALQLAVAYSTRTSISAETPDGGELPPAEVADLQLFSDGRLADAERDFVLRGEMTFHRIGAAEDNVGIVAFDLRRDLERPGTVAAFVQVENFGPAVVKTDVSLSIDGAMPNVQEVTLGPARQASSLAAEGGAAGDIAAAQNVVFEIENSSGGVAEITLNRKDALDIDDIVTAPLTPPRPIRILSVSDRLEVQAQMSRAFQKALDIRDFTEMTTAQYEAADESVMSTDGRSAFDLVVLDKHDTDRLSPGNYIFLGGIPKIESVSREKEDVDEQVFVNWRDSHPLLRYVPLEKVVALKWARLKLPSHAVSLIEGENSTVMAFITDPGHRYVISAFDLLESNFFKRPAMIVFLQNAVEYLAAGGLSEGGRLIHPGDTIALQVPPGADKLEVRTPDQRRAELDATHRQNVTFAETETRGLYAARFNNPAGTTDLYGANVLDAVESLIRPAKELRLGSGKVEASEAVVNVNRPLWPHAVAVALFILMIEWWVYNKRVMI